MMTSQKQKPGKLDISPEINERFRALVIRRYSVKKGNFKRAAEEAVIGWCDKIEAELKKNETIKS